LPVLPHPAPPEDVERLDNAVNACWEQLGLFSWAALPVDEAAYQRMVKSRECLIAHGFDVASPPTVDEWISGGGAWNPHSAAWDELGAAGLSRDESVWVEMNEACPQPGPMIFSVTGSF